MDQSIIRNIAIIAHVDHGKTSLVDEMFTQSGLYRDNQIVENRVMDSMDLEKERGITIAAKNGSFEYKGHWINIIDTPGHADFGGQVERVLKMADGALLLVDAQEGPMPQTFFVLKKALALHLPILVVINKIDKPAARCSWAVDQVFDLFVKLNAPDDILDFKVVYSSAKLGYARLHPDDENDNIFPLIDKIIEHMPPPKGSPTDPLQMLISSIDYSPYLGRLGIGKITGGTLSTNKEIAVSLRDGTLQPTRVSKLYRFRGNEKVPIETAGVGEVVAVAGLDNVTVGVTFTDPSNPCPLPPTVMDPPTLSMSFIPNDSPFAGLEGQFVTSRHLEDRLRRETLSDVALVVQELTDRVGYKVSGRGELHLSILIERMRREGYEFQVTRPEVIYQKDGERVLEPYEELTVDVEENYVGAVIEKLGVRKGQMVSLEQNNGMARLVYKIPTRGLLGYRSEFLTDTKGTGIMNYIFSEYGTYAGEIRYRKNGVLIAKENCSTVAFALFNLQDRGKMFLGPGVPVYAGMIVGEHSRGNDLIVNPGKAKKLTNMRASGTDDNIVLTPPFVLSLEDYISYINDDELVEITPKSIRIRKIKLKQ
jgi:GTP-binding protein